MSWGRHTVVQLGERYGNLAVVAWRARPDGQKGRAVLVRCDCGTEKVLYPHALRSGNTRSCGCWRRSAGAAVARSAWMKFPGEAAFNHLFTSYRSAAKRNEREWGLTRDEFLALTKLPCHYCGAKPSKAYRTTNGCNGTYTYNGVDRVDNSRGYVTDNCVACCAICNRMKGVFTAAEYINRARAVAVRHGLIVT